ncbi:MAG: hypothetical protein EOP84_08345, partial [Verrucomicrobiaceae bacterium]
PYIGKGNAASPNVLSGETDLAGNSRVTAGKTDYGAFQNGVSINPIALAAAPEPTITQARGGDIVLTIAGSSTSAFVWEFNDGTGWKSLSQLPASVVNSVTSLAGIGTLTLNSVGINLSGYQFRVTMGEGSFTSAPTVVSVVEPEIMYVDAAAPAGGDGRTWATAYTRAETAIKAANVMRRVIYIAEGTYPDSRLQITDRVEIYGGFPAGGGARDPLAHPTIISGATTATEVIAFWEASSGLPLVKEDTILDGLTIQGGQIGVGIYQCRPTLRNLVIQNNAGNGMSVWKTSSLIENCQLHGNSAAGLSGNDAHTTLSKCSFRGNLGGGINLYNSAVLLVQSVVSGNRSTSYGGGIALVNSQLSFESSVLIGNLAATVGGGIFVDSASSATIHNSILRGNRSTDATIEQQQLSQHNRPGAYSVAASNVEGVSIYAAGAVDIDPLFVGGIDASAAPTKEGDFRLNSASPVINGGNNSYAADLATDLAGAPRIFGSAIDLGPYEYQAAPDAPLAITTQPSDLVFSRANGAVNQFHVQLAGTTFTYQWEVSKAGSPFTDVTDDAIAGVQVFSGSQTDTLTILVGDPYLDGARFRCKITASAGGSAHTKAALLTVYPARYYFDESAPTGAGDGLTWATAFKTAANFNSLKIDPANGVEMWFATGTYRPDTLDATKSFSLKSNVALYGGFPAGGGEFASRDISANPTILSGITGTIAVFSNGAVEGFQVVPLTGLRIDGFKVTGGATGILNSRGVTLTVANCIFTGLTDGIRNLHETALTVANCQFTDLVGTGISVSACTIRVSDSVFAGNARGISLYQADFEAVRCAFRGNHSPADSGAGVYSAFATNLKFDDCLFSGNRALSGGGIYSVAENPRLRNCTFSGNYGEQGGGGMVASTAEIYNSIFWGNGSGLSGATVYTQLSLSSDSATAKHNVIQDVPVSLQFPQNSENVAVDPGFVSTIVAAPSLPGRPGYAIAGGYFVFSMITNTPTAPIKLIPFKVHGMVEIVAGLGLLAAPWLFHFENGDRAK